LPAKKQSYLYGNNPKVKWIILAISGFISAMSLYYTDYLVTKLKDREIKIIEIYARTLEYTINEDLGDQMLFFTQEIIIPNNEIPLILVNSTDVIQDYRNLDMDSSWTQIRQNQRLEEELTIMRDTYEPKLIMDRDEETGDVLDHWFIYYRNSKLLTQLTYYPIVQLSIIAIFGFIAYLIFNYSRTADQNRVWVGLAKETAHQLGTPISSLMAWVEYFREDPGIKNKGIIEELDKDIKKLQLITERFSNIGSIPVLNEESVEEVINNVVGYLRPRISSKVSMDIIMISKNITAKLNPPLFEWVIENMCKNAVDSMNGVGNIRIKIMNGSDHRVFVDITDTGKGMSKSKMSQVFNPGFTTKKRGWGLGLTLAKRIVEVYHKGKVFVKESEENKGTTFRIILNA
jgi:signal transduction histidine kinase